MKIVTSSSVILLAALSAKGNSSFDTSDQYAWSGNAGWISFRHDRPAAVKGVILYPTYLSGLAYSANVGWINFGNTPTNELKYANDGNDRGVNHDSTGNLSGYAWGANVGWINFGWADSDDENRPRVDLLTGEMNGYAWSGNLGWINLGTDQLTVAQMLCRDKDADGLDDQWELIHYGDLETCDPDGDDDGDGFSNAYEEDADTNPFKNEGNFKIIAFSTEGDDESTTGKISFTSRQTRLYRVQYSLDLGENNPWQFLSEEAIGEPSGITSIPFKLDESPKAFFRVVPVKPLSE